MSEDKGRPLPKFGEWDVNNPASADGFTVIFSKARDDKKTNNNNNNGAAASNGPPPQRSNRPNENYQNQSPVHGGRVKFDNGGQEELHL